MPRKTSSSLRLAIGRLLKQAKKKRWAALDEPEYVSALQRLIEDAKLGEAQPGAAKESRAGFRQIMMALLSRLPRGRQNPRTQNRLGLVQAYKEDLARYPASFAFRRVSLILKELIRLGSSTEYDLQSRRSARRVFEEWGQRAARRTNVRSLKARAALEMMALRMRLETLFKDYQADPSRYANLKLAISNRRRFHQAVQQWLQGSTMLALTAQSPGQPPVTPAMTRSILTVIPATWEQINADFGNEADFRILIRNPFDRGQFPAEHRLFEAVLQRACRAEAAHDPGGAGILWTFCLLLLLIEASGGPHPGLSSLLGSARVVPQRRQGKWKGPTPIIRGQWRVPTAAHAPSSSQVAEEVALHLLSRLLVIRKDRLKKLLLTTSRQVASFLDQAPADLAGWGFGEFILSVALRIAGLICPAMPW